MARASDLAAAIGGFLRRHLSWFLAIGLAALGVAGFLWWQARSQRPHYVTAAVTRGNIRRAVSMTGALNPRVTVQVGSYVSGQVKTLHCDFNTDVVVGQVCATIDPVPFQLIVDQDRAEVGTAEAQLKKDQAAQLYAKTAFERDSKLLAEGTVSQDAVDNDKSVYDQVRAQIGLDQATIVNKLATLKAAEVNLAYTNIVSPVAGTVITRSIDVGQTVAASLQSPTRFIIGKDLTRMQVDTNVSESDVGVLRVGQDAYFSVQAFPGRTFQGKVTQIRHGPITVQNVVTYDAVVAVDNPDRALFPGMTADTHIVIDEHDGVLRVPLPAVRFNPAGIGRPRDASQARTEQGPQAPPGPPETAEKIEGGGESSPGAGREGGRGGRRRESGRASGSPARPGDGSREATEGAEGRRGPRREGRPGGRAAARLGGGARQSGLGAGAGGERRRSQVWVLDDDGSLRPVAVTTGLDDGALIEVSGKDLKPGDRVVVNEIKPGEQRQRPAGPNPNQVLRQGGPRL
ncbi:MAG: efflux RND transporter periplasmic adaptor subunit [Acidobacteria bacterium]|nr:efflux RND transporter periplasmic adaptor subunit [Acidobacteriota bacterium]